jgi:signal transduction histidine kinase
MARRRAEARLPAAHARLRAATERTQAEDQVKSAFLATMSHEVRTLLESIIAGDRECILAAGCNGYVGKRIDPDTSARHVARHLARPPSGGGDSR